MRPLALMLVFAAFAAAQGPQPPQPTAFNQTLTFGIVGVATGQTARVSVLNLGVQPFLGARVEPGTMPAPMPVAVQPCQVQVQFLDSQGNGIGQPTTPPALDPGKSASADLAGPGGTAQRTQFRAVIRTMVPTPAAGAPMPFRPSCNIVATLEVFDNSTGATRFVLENPRFMPMPVPATHMMQ